MYLVRTTYVLCKHLLPDIYPVSISTYLVSTCLFYVLLCIVLTNNSLFLNLIFFNNLFFFHPSCPASAPCAPEILNMTQTSSSAYTVFITTPNSGNTNYTITATRPNDMLTCQTKSSSCALTQVPCGATYEVMAVATTAAGTGLPGFSKTLETGTA